MEPRLSDEQRLWLDYFRDLGFVDVVLPDASATQSKAPEPVSEAVLPKTRQDEPAPSAASGPRPPGDEDLAALALRASKCRACKLAEGRKTVVFGSGATDADLMFIGEGPGAQEDLQGLPFVGPAGELLTRIIGAIDLTRDEVYIANIVKCRPPGNRDPEPDEVAACRDYLNGQIDLVRPKAIVALGRVAAQTLLGSDLALGRLRGQWHAVRDIPTRVTYHPAALLRNSGYRAPTWDDMQAVRDRLAEST